MSERSSQAPSRAVFATRRRTRRHPARAPTERRVDVNGITLTIFEWHLEDKGRADPIVLAHATGFHARCWDQVVRHLGPRYAIAVDQRGHGRSDKPLPVRWEDFGQDLTALVQQLDLRHIVGVGHSMGGHAMTEAAAALPRRFRRLVLIDPVIGSPADYTSGSWIAERLNGALHPIAKRRNHWSSARAMFDRFKGRVPFSAFDRSVLRDYCEHGILPDPRGHGYVLACPPEFEAAVYMMSRSNAGVYDSIHAVSVPVLIVRAMEAPPDRDIMDFRYSPTFPGLVRHFKHGHEVYLKDQTHFLPMQDPALVARYILADERARHGSGKPKMRDRE